MNASHRLQCLCTDSLQSQTRFFVEFKNNINRYNINIFNSQWPACDQRFFTVFINAPLSTFQWCESEEGSPHWCL